MNKKFINIKNNFSKSAPGLSLIEASIAILMVAISATAIINLQSTLSRGVFNAHSHIARLYLGKNLFVIADKEKWYAEKNQRTQTHEDPKTTLTYKAEESQHKALKNFPSIISEKVTISWKGIFAKPQEETLLTFRFDPKAKP